MPCRTAPACPERPPPLTVQTTSNWSARPAAANGWLISIRSVGRAKKVATSRPLTVIRPDPRFSQTRATASLRRPVA